MTLQEQQNIQEDIYNEKIKLGDDILIENDDIPAKMLSPQNKDKVSFKVFYRKKENYKRDKILTLLKFKDNIYPIFEDDITDKIKSISDDAYDLSQEDYLPKSKLREILKLYIFGIGVSHLHTNNIIFKENDNKKLLKSLIKQQLLTRQIIREYYLNDLEKIVGKENLIKNIKSGLSEKEMNEIFNKFKPFRYRKIDTLLSYLEKQFNKNKNIDPDKFISDKIYAIYLNEVSYNKDLFFVINKFSVSEKGFYTYIHRFYSKKGKDFDGIKGPGSNKLFIEVNNKKDFLKILKLHNFFNSISNVDKVFNVYNDRLIFGTMLERLNICPEEE